MSTPTADQLHSAAIWLEEYEGAEDDDMGADCAAVAAWLRHRVQLLEESARVTKLQQELLNETGRKPTTAQVRAALRSTR